MVASSRAMTRHLLFVITIGVASVAAQDSPRQIWDSGFRQKRPAPSAKPSTSAPPTTPDYRVAAGPAPVTTAGARLVGFTLWRLRRAVDGDTTPRLLVQDSGPSPEELVPERISPGESLAVGDRIRLGFEVAQRGYLYVIDRERYADGSRGAPYLLFPARNLRGGDNRVEPGRLIEIPAQGDDVPALRVRRSESRHVGEELTVLVTEKPVDGIVLGEWDTKLPEDLVQRWERQWGTGGAVPRLDLLASPAESAWTASEKSSGLAQRLLTQDDPLPAALYQGQLKGGGTSVRIPLSVR
jgi:hypothetical protein